MNAAALKTQYKFVSPQPVSLLIQIVPEIGFGQGGFKTENPIEEMGIKQDVIAAPISQMVKELSGRYGMITINAEVPQYVCTGIGLLVVYRDLTIAENFLREKFAKKPAIAEANIKVIHAGYDYGIIHMLL